MRSRLLGILCTLFLGSAQANLIVNGGFEDPVVADNPPQYVYQSGNELPGWTIFSSVPRGIVHFNTGYAHVTEGSQAVQLEFAGDQDKSELYNNHRR